MDKAIKILVTLTCIIAGLSSFLYLCFRNRDILGEYYAQSSINVEIDFRYASDAAIAVETSPNPCSYWLSPTTTEVSGIGTVIIHKSIPLKRPFWNPALQFPKETAEKALHAIDHIAFFTGNKLHYFSSEDVKNFKREDADNYAYFYLPGIYYKKSKIGWLDSFSIDKWSNYYGDFNFLVIALTSFFLFPARFIPVYLLLSLLFLMYRKRIVSLHESVLKNKEKYEYFFLVVIIISGFILRFNGYVHHSGWSDELFSAVYAGNPITPFLNTFSDPGNPPFYFILLRFFFLIFGWSEETGTMLSVLTGTLSIITLYILVNEYFGKKAGLFAAVFTAFSGFSIGYSQEMRCYILIMALVPVVSFALLKYINNPSSKNLIFYILPSILIVNTHFYGILFIIANYLFFISLLLYQKRFEWKKFIVFSLGNFILLLSFMPYFLYMLLIVKSDFLREFIPEPGHTLVFSVIVIFAAVFFVSRKKLNKIIDEHIKSYNQKIFFSFLVIIPVFIFLLAFLISFIRPMITFRYLWSVCAPLCFALIAVIVKKINSFKRIKCLTPLLIYMIAVGLYGIKPDIPSGGIEGYKEARSYIAADAAANPERKSVMLDNAPGNSGYYGYPQLPSYSQDTDADVLYVYNDIFRMHEIDMYDDLKNAGFELSGMLRVHFDYKYPRADGGVIFKKYLR